ncbi:hypothetical protein INR49_016504 [Caranx melampygus]|nr:hypothetical protein INR49_016504 [Caranx melampygus]
MLRCAAAAGCHNVLLTKGCVDAWEPKVLRAAMGAHFRLPIYPSVDWDKMENHLPKAVTVHVADSSCGPDRSRQTEDLQMNASHKPSKAGDYGWVSTRRSHSDVRYEEYDSDSEDEGLSLPRVGSKLYHESWAQSPTALVIGGETHGLSLESVQLAEKTADGLWFELFSQEVADKLLHYGRRDLFDISDVLGAGRHVQDSEQRSCFWESRCRRRCLPLHPPTITPPTLHSSAQNKKDKGPLCCVACTHSCDKAQRVSTVWNLLGRGKKILCHSAQLGLPPERLPTYCCLMDTENPAAGLARSVRLPGLTRAKEQKSGPRS